MLRLRAGDEVVLFDGSGTEYSAVVAAAEKGALRCTVTAGAPSQKAVSYTHLDVYKRQTCDKWKGTG